jgi:hypothetical protein
VSKNFRDILKIWWSYAVIDLFRSGFAFIAISSKSELFAYIYQIFGINDLLGIAAVIMVH